MSDRTTFLTQKETKDLVKLCGQQIREFMTFLNDPGAVSPFAEIEKTRKLLGRIEPAIMAQAKNFRKNPELFSDRNLVKYGQKVLPAVSYPVRIEVRKMKGVAGMAQIAVRGVCDQFRRISLQEIEEHRTYDSNKFYIRVSGNSSFEINRQGVDKALPLRYLYQRWEYILRTIRYTPGTCIDSRKTNTLITADGDGTTYDSPRLDEAPNLNTSAAYEALLRFLGLGGIYVIISGNHLDRTISRVKNYIPSKIRNRLLVAANGGANLICFDHQGKVKEIQDYRKNALTCLKSRSPDAALDLIYIGDDGRLSGNDKEAFEAVGAGRSILVAKDKADDIIPFLAKNHVGGLVSGTKRVLEFVNEWAVGRPGKKIFTKTMIDQMKRFAVS